MTDSSEPRFQRFTSRVGEASYEIEVARDGAGYLLRLGEKIVPVDWRTLGGERALVTIEGRAHAVRLHRTGTGKYLSEWRGRQVPLEVEDELATRAAKAHTAAGRGAGGPVTLNAPMPGTVIQILVPEGGTVAAGQPVLIIEAMKMQNEVAAPAGGVIKKLSVRPGQAVEARQPMCVIAPAG